MEASRRIEPLRNLGNYEEQLGLDYRNVGCGKGGRGVIPGKFLTKIIGPS
jgi:hypothetical protein